MRTGELESGREEQERRVQRRADGVRRVDAAAAVRPHERRIGLLYCPLAWLLLERHLLVEEAQPELLGVLVGIDLHPVVVLLTPRRDQPLRVVALRRRVLR